MNDIDNMQDFIDIRDVIERVEELREECEAYDGTGAWARECPDDADELTTLESLLSELCGNGGDEKWEGNWYPRALIRDSHFEEYAEQLANDIGATNNEAHWPNSCIDWECAARELQMDYSSVEYDGATYWYR